MEFIWPVKGPAQRTDQGTGTGHKGLPRAAPVNVRGFVYIAFPRDSAAAVASHGFILPGISQKDMTFCRVCSLASVLVGLSLYFGGEAGGRS